jgi:heme-degrading monooxygenase HmoA
MAVLFTARGITDENAYRGVFEHVRDDLERAPGFVAHGAGPAGEGWQVVEIWESREDIDRWLEEHIRPTLPPGMEPQFDFQELENVLTR